MNDHSDIDETDFNFVYVELTLSIMPNTFSRIYLHFVFAVRGRANLISKEFKHELHKYIGGLVRRRQAKMLAVHCMPDHVHLFVGFRPVMSISDFIKEIKVESNEFINERKWVRRKFQWQEGYGVFSHSHAQLDTVIKYILNQESHHRKKKFQEEYRKMLTEVEIPYDERYLFEFYD